MATRTKRRRGYQTATGGLDDVVGLGASGTGGFLDQGLPSSAGGSTGAGKWSGAGTDGASGGAGAGSSARPHGGSAASAPAAPADEPRVIVTGELLRGSGMLIGTHAGRFRTDEVVACALLLLHPDYSNSCTSCGTL